MRLMRAAGAGILATVIAIVGLVGCGLQTDTFSVGMQSPGGAPNCSAGGRQLVESFVDGFNRGDALQLDRLFAGPGVFEWYSTDAPGERVNDDAVDRSSLIEYFAQRHNHHERLDLRSSQFTGVSPSGLGNFEFELLRSADDGLVSTPYGGKGAFNCQQSPYKIVAWSMARQPFLRSDLPIYGLLVVLITLAGGIGLYRWRRKAR
jgi:hypothetical protein